MSNEFVGHPLLDVSSDSKIDINQIFEKNKALISIFPGSRTTEIDVLMPILLDFIKLMNKDYQDFKENITDKEIKEFYEQNQSFFMKPKKYKIEYVLFEKSDFMGLMAGAEYTDDKTFLSIQKINI